MATKAQKAEQAEAIEQLRGIFTPGQTIYTVLRHRSRSGMMRVVSVVATRDGWEGAHVWDVSGLVARAVGLPFDRDRGGVKVGGCGFDAGHDLVYNIGWALYPDGGTCTGEGCPSNDHSNGDRDYTPGKPHRDGGYTFRHSWL